MGVLINGKELAEKLRLNLKEKIEEEGLKPKLAVILLGNDEASKLYVKIKLDGWWRVLDTNTWSVVEPSGSKEIYFLFW